MYSRHHAALLLTTVAMVPSAALAQTETNVNAQNDVEADAGEYNSQIEEIVVQARRVDESQQQVPIAISTVTSERLQSAVVSSTDDIQRLVPNLQINQTTTGQLDFIIRGSFAGFGVDPSVVTYIDDVPQDSRVIVYGLFDLSSVQQLKGPQGTLFGRNSTGGAMLFASKRPDIDEVGAYANIRLGSLAEQRFEGAFNLPLTDNLAIRVAGQVERRDGTFRSVTSPGLEYDNRHNQAVRGSVLWQPSSMVENYTQVTHYRADEHRSPFIAVSLAGPCTGPTTPAVACLFQPPFNALLGTDDLRTFVDQQLALPFGETVNNDPVADYQARDSITNTLTVDLGALSLRNTSYYGEIRSLISRDYDGTPARVVDGSTDERVRTFYTETQAFGSVWDDRIDWRFGVVHSNDRGLTSNYQNVFPIPGSLVTPRLATSRTNFKSTALFGQADFDLSSLLPNLSLTAGYRYTWDKRKVATTAFSGASDICSLQVLPVPATGPVPFPNTTLADCTRRLNLNHGDDNYNLTLQWTPVDRVLLYAATRKGYKSGSFNVLTVDPALAQYEAEVIHDIELGVKADWRIGNVPIRTNAALFRAKYNNVQTSLTLVDPNSGSVTAVTINEDLTTGQSNRATIKGFEVEATIIPFKGLELSGFYSKIDAEYARFFTISPRLDLQGENVAGVTPETAGGAARLSIPDLGPFTLNAMASYYWRAAPLTNAASELTAAPPRAYEQIDARVAFSELFGSGLEVAFFVKNLTDNRNVLSNNIVSGAVTNRFTEPRTYGLDVTFRFGSDR